MTTRELAAQLLGDLKAGKLKSIGGKDVKDAVDREWPRDRERLIMAAKYREHGMNVAGSSACTVPSCDHARGGWE